MKKFILLSLLLPICAASFAQRTADLSTATSSPDSTTVVIGAGTFNFTGTLTNNGPDTLKPTDTILVYFYLDGGSKPVNVKYSGSTFPCLLFTMPAGLMPGNGASTNLPLSLATYPGAGKHQLCEIAFIFNHHADSLHDPNMANNITCANITFQNAASVTGPALAGNQVSVYPNPAGATATISFAQPLTQSTSITVSDIYGRRVFTAGNVAIGATSYQLNTEALPTGTYIYNIRSGSNTAVGRLQVVH